MNVHGSVRSSENGHNSPSAIASRSREVVVKGREVGDGRKETREVRTSRLRVPGSEGKQILQPLLRMRGQSSHLLRVRAYCMCRRGNGSGVTHHRPIASSF